MNKEMPQKGTGFSLKDHLFNEAKVRYLGGLFSNAVRGFDAGAFALDTMAELPKLELKARITHIAAALEGHLSSDFAVASQQIVAALPPPLDPALSDDDFGDFIMAPLGEYVVRNGLVKKYVRKSLKTLQEITQRFSMEDAIRAFINAFPEETLSQLDQWSKHKNYHVRRLVSEGTRPTLPWSCRINLEPEVALRFLDALYCDSTRYVTRSVCNHLNDISKTQPDLVLKTLKRWKKEKRQTAAEFDWMSKHALRTLVKRGNSAALRFLGFNEAPQITVSEFRIGTQRVRAGESLEFEFSVTAERDESLVVDYVIDFLKASGSHSPKVHKLKQLNLNRGQTALVRKRHPFRANATTYTLYPGTHFVTLQINGSFYGKLAFELT